MQAKVECPAAYLPPHLRSRLVRIALEEGYAVKDLAEIMGVSSAAVSRYVHGTLSPSVESTCRLIFSVDDRLRARMLEEITLELLNVVENLVDTLAKTAAEKPHIILSKLEHVADKISSIMLKATARETVLKP